MSSITADQLSYILERKFIDSLPGEDYVITESLVEEDRKLQPAGDAVIAEWFLPDIDKPTTEQIEQWWEKLYDEYHGDPQREDSKMAQFYKERNKRTVTVNEEI